jgi:hypothetical protein
VRHCTVLPSDTEILSKEPGRVDHGVQKLLDAVKF